VGGSDAGGWSAGLSPGLLRAELLFPGPNNPFERAAGLAKGGYVVEDGVPPKVAGMGLGLAAAALLLRERRRIRRLRVL
jgi:MYXO-CTERM domain-containing protein